jgi:uncharacterized protein YacL
MPSFFVYCEDFMSLDFFFRIVGMIVLSIAGLFLGIWLGDLAGGAPDRWASVFASLGALTGLIIAPFLTVRPARSVRRVLMTMSVTTLSAGTIGLVVGLIIGALASLPLSLLPSPFGQFLPVLSALVFGYLGLSLFVIRADDIFSLFGSRLAPSPTSAAAETRTILLDTSVIIDGRIYDVAATGFLQSVLLVPRFVLNELQFIADSADPIRRQRGRRGLEVLNRLQKEPRTPLRVTDLDFEDMHATDDKLVVLAKQLRCPILTNDYNLNRVAELQGVTVLNLNDLANAVRTIFLPGELLNVHILQEGKEQGQGVGYLEDGTMVVVEDGRRYIEQSMPVLVTKVLQTSAGRMIFARIENSSNGNNTKFQ